MNTPEKSAPWRLLGALLIVSSLLNAATAQTPAAETKDSEIVILSPFVVDASSDVGYSASESLAGTGLKTNLTDLGASVSVVTSKFLEDTGSKNLGDILVYQANMEVRGFGGNLSGASPSGGGISVEPNLGNSSTGTRVRGLAGATQARNFYRSIIPMEGYNTDRVEINRGANALLFGVGSPAGIINSSTTSAELYKNFGDVELSTGSHGSWRASFDYNLAIKKDELAIRVAAVRDEEQYQQKFAYTDTERKYVAATWDVNALRKHGILTSSTFRASFEKGGITSNNPRVLPPNDRLASWFDATLPDELKALGARGKVAYDPTAGPFNAFNSTLGNATVGVIANVNRSAVYIFQDVNATAPRDNIPISATGETVFGRPFVSNNVFYPSTGLTGIAVGAGSREMSRVRLDYGFPDQSFYTAENLSDPTVFNFFDNVLVGPNSEADSNLQAFEASFQQLLFDGKAGVEVAFNRQRWNEGAQDLLSESNPYIAIDVNSHMWTGEVNPNFGRPFISTSGSADYFEQQIDTSRAKLFYELDLEDMMDGRAGKILGKHVFSLLGQREILETESHNAGVMFYTPDIWTNGSNQSRRASGSKQIVTWVYLGPSLTNATSPSGANLPGLQQDLTNFQDEVNGKGVVISRVQAPNAGAAQLPAYVPYTTPQTVLREDRLVSNTAGSGRLDERTLDSQAFSLQSKWLSDHFVSTVGWRKEKSSIVGVNAPPDTGGEGYVLINDPSFSVNNPTLTPQVFEETLFAWSAVAKVPKSWLDRIPSISALNVYYGSSENFNPPSGRTVDTFGNEIPPPSGITKETGIYLEAFNRRLTARLNFFETTQTGDFNDAVGGIPGVIVGIHAQAFSMVKSGLVPDGGNGFPVNYIAPPQELLDLFDWKVVNGTASTSNPGVRDTSDFVAKGTELEIMYRPTGGLSFIMNVSEQESVRSNTGAATERLLFNTPTSTGAPIATEWLKDWAYQIPLNGGALGKEGSRTDQNILANNFQFFTLNRFNTAASADGAVVHELRKWRANFVGNYDFQGGSLKGFGIGSGVRWLDKSALGYPVATFESDLGPSDGIDEISDIRISDVRNPLYGPSETRFDAWVSYQTRILNDQVGLKLQLNVRNIFTNDELVPAVINPDGSVPVWTIGEGRRFMFSAKFSF